MRNHFAKELVKLAEADDSIVLLYGDIGNRLFATFKGKFPRRYFNCGVAEANMVGVAAGLAKSGFKPWVYTINSFLYLKALEQIKLDVCYQQLPVTLVGTGGGLSYSELGTTHHSLEDLGVLSQLPHLSVFAPGTISALKETMAFVQSNSKPSYLRIGKKEEFDAKFELIQEAPDFLGIFELESDESTVDLTILSVGTIVENVSCAVSQVRASGIKIKHFHVPQVSPMNSNSAMSLFSSCAKLLVIEEHYSTGGLYAQLCVIRMELDSQVKLYRLGPRQSYFVGLGNLEEARNSLEISPEGIYKKIVSLL